MLIIEFTSKAKIVQNCLRNMEMHNNSQLIIKRRVWEKVKILQDLYFKTKTEVNELELIY